MSIKMAKYSKQIIDSVSKDLKDTNIKVISSDLENLIVDYLLEKVKKTNKWPSNWESAGFHPAGNIQDTFFVLGYFYPQVPTWKVEGTGGGLIEAFIFDKKYSVVASSPSRALILAIWNYTQLAGLGE